MCFGTNVRHVTYNHPSDLFAGQVTIVGANIEHGYVLITDNVQQDDVLTTNEIIDSCEKDNDLHGYILIVKTNEDGEFISV